MDAALKKRKADTHALLQEKLQIGIQHLLKRDKPKVFTELPKADGALYHMDLAAMKAKVMAEEYSDFTQFIRDFMAMWNVFQQQHKPASEPAQAKGGRASRRNAAPTPQEEEETELMKNATKFYEEGLAFLTKIQRMKGKVDASVKEEPEGKIGVKLTANVQLTRQATAQNGSTTLAVYAETPIPANAQRLGSKLPPVKSIMPVETNEKNWFGATPATDLSHGPFSSFEPLYDSKKATLTDSDAALLLDPPEHLFPESPVDDKLEIKSTMDYCKRIAAVVGRMNVGNKELHAKVKSLASLSKDNGRFAHILDEFKAEQSTTDAQRAAAAAKPGIPCPFYEEPKYEAPAVVDDSTPLEEIMRINTDIIKSLQAAQHRRIASGRPWQILDIEKTLSKALSGNLKIALKRTSPEELNVVPLVRDVMGVQVKKRKAKKARTDKQGDEGDATGAPADLAEADSQQQQHQQQQVEDQSEQQSQQQQPRQQQNMEPATPAAPVPPVEHIRCAVCNGYGLPWSGVSFAVTQKMCHACGLEYLHSRRVKPGLFAAGDSCEMTEALTAFVQSIKTSN